MRFKAFILLILSITVFACSTDKQQAEDLRARLHISKLKIGMSHDSVIAIFPGTRLAKPDDCFDIEGLGPNGGIYLGFDSANRLDYLSQLYCPYSLDTQTSDNPRIAEIRHRVDSMEAQQSFILQSYISGFTRYEDSIKDFTFAGTIRGWKTYWWKEPLYQLYVSIDDDSMFVNIQSQSSLTNPKRKNTKFILPQDSTILYFPYRF